MRAWANFAWYYALEENGNKSRGKTSYSFGSAYIDHCLLLQHRPFIQSFSSLILALGAMFLTSSLQKPAQTVIDRILPEK